MTLPPCMLWIDPGGMTGLAALFSSPLRFVADEFRFGDACRNIEATCLRYTSGLAVGWEKTQIMPNSPKDLAVAFEVTGAARFLAMKWGCTVLPEAQRHTPTADEQSWLKAIGWWVPAKNDAQSAACHLMRYLQRTGNIPSELAVKLARARHPGR